MSSPDLSQMSMLDLFRQEADNQTRILNHGLLHLEQSPNAADQLEACMRAAHSLKGAARIIGLQAGVDIAHVMEDCFVFAQKGTLQLKRRQIDTLLQGTDLLARIANPPDQDESWALHAGRAEVEACIANLTAAQQNSDADEEAVLSRTVVDEAPEESANSNERSEPESRDIGSRSLRVSAENLDRLLSLSGESLVESRRLATFKDDMLRLKRLQRDTTKTIEQLDHLLNGRMTDELTQNAFHALRSLQAQCQHMVAEQLGELESFDRRSLNLSQRLYDEALACRMRPFSDGTSGYSRMVRDVAHALGKSVQLQILGLDTRIDRDILEKLDAPLGHLLRNAIDHGIEMPAARRLACKTEQGHITIEARHSAGMLLVNVSDDGDGIDLDRLRQAIVARKLSNAETVARLSESELLDFLLLPGFSMRETVTDISGRGIGLDVVGNMLKEVRGTIRITSEAGKGTRFQLQLPLTLSVMRSLLVSIDNEPYAFPLAYVNRTLHLQADQLSMLEGRQHFHFEGRQIGLVAAHQILQKGSLHGNDEGISVVVIGNQHQTCGIAVDRFLGERMLVVQPLDERIGKIPDILAGALMENGTPLLILDVADMLRSVEKLSRDGQLQTVQQDDGIAIDQARKRILIVDDSLTVRELERKLLGNVGYQVTVAVDGMDGWNAVRTDHYDLVITDIDMPRMDGIELVSLIRQSPSLGKLPVMIVSYKDREEDRQRGLDAGADYYFTKSSFHDASLLQAVNDLIGAA